jgi:hypothetical protein
MKPKVRLTGTDGNAFSIIGKVSKALKQVGQAERAKEFREKAFAAKSYEALLGLACEYCEIS